MDSATARDQFERRAIRLETSPALGRVLDNISRVNENFDDSRYVIVKAYMRSLGSDRVYELSTYEISSREVFIMCENPKVYPFLVNQTLIDVVLSLKSLTELKDLEVEYISFIGKVENTSVAKLDKGPNGFLVKIAQMGFDERRVYEEILLKKS